MNKLLLSKDINQFFQDRDYTIVKPSNIINNNKDTVFISSGIQPLLFGYLKKELESNKEYFVAQPVIRTQYLEQLSEGTSLAFVNSTTSKFNLSEEDYQKLVKDWLEFFYSLGLEKDKITTTNDFYEDTWKDLSLSGKRTFYYYDNLEIGDSTFFTKVDHKEIESMCDLGFGVERVRWCTNKGKSYFDFDKDTKHLSPEEKALISAITLLAINGVIPSQKNSGYRARLFSKHLADLLSAKKLSEADLEYFKDCIKYWKDWQKPEKELDFSLIENEYERNCNSIIKSELLEEGYKINGINVNISWDEMKKRLQSSGVPKERIKRIVR